MEAIVAKNVPFLVHTLYAQLRGHNVVHDIQNIATFTRDLARYVFLLVIQRYEDSF